MKGKVFKIIAVVLLIILTALLIWNIVEYIKTICSNMQVVKLTNEYYDDKSNEDYNTVIQRLKKSTALAILRTIYSLFAIFSSGCFVYGIVKSMYTIEVAAKIKYSTEQIDEYISILKSRRQVKKKARDEKRRKKLQEELNKYEES